MKNVSASIGIILLAISLSVFARSIGNDLEIADITTLPTITTISITSTITEIGSSQTVLMESSSDSSTKCDCAVFATETPTDADIPIILQSPTNVNCDTEGENICLKACLTLAEAAKEGGAELFCSSVGHYDHLKTSVHSRICGSTKWTYTGLTSPNVICCHQNQVIDCKDLPQEPPKNQL